MHAKRQAAWDRFSVRRRPERQRHLEQLLDDAASSIREREREEPRQVDLEDLVKRSLRGEEGR
jgi:hypothetical protein